MSSLPTSNRPGLHPVLLEMTFLLGSTAKIRRLMTSRPMLTSIKVICTRSAMPRGTLVRTLTSAQPSDRNGNRSQRIVTPSQLFTSAFGSTAKMAQASYASLTDVVSRVAKSDYGRLMRLDKPTGTQLLFLPCAWSISLTASTFGDWMQLMPLFYIGAVLLRGAGCTINDIWDADVDREVERTRDRPIASGAISTFSAFSFLAAQLGGGLIVLTQLNEQCFPLAALAVLPVMAYPHAKRLVRFPQAVLGLTINAGALLGSTAAVGKITPECALFYLGGLCWTMVYDTIYAHQDKKDDAKIGVMSTAQTFGVQSKNIMTVFVGGYMCLFSVAGTLGHLSWPYFVCLGASGMHLTSTISGTDLDNPEDCASAFKKCATAGAMLAGGIMASRIF